MMTHTLLTVAGVLAAGVLAAGVPAAPDPTDTDLGGMVDALLRAAIARHPEDEGLARAHQAIRRVQEFGGEDMVDRERMTVRRGKFDRGAGVLHISGRTPAGRPLPPAVLRGTVVHEVAHATQPDGTHSKAWRDTYVRLLRVATEDMGWTVTLECSACTMYDVCSKDDCPRCGRIACRR